MLTRLLLVNESVSLTLTVPYSGLFWTGIPVWAPKMSTKFFFIKQLTNTFLLCEIYGMQDILVAYL